MCIKKYLITVLIFMVAVVLSLASPSWANRASVEIIAPGEAAMGSTVTIKINVSHNGNNSFHHTDWVYVKDGDKEIGRWEFTSDKLPENENFTREVKVTITGPVNLEAKADCNLHGSAGPKKALIKVK